MDLKEKLDSNRSGVHPWELSRAESILKILKYLPKETVYADIGSGDMFFTKRLLNYTINQIYAVDINYNDLDDNDSNIDNIIKLNNVNDIKDNSVNCIVLMDVLEHIENENEFLENVLDKLMEGGTILITVPAHQFLFSEHDKFLDHYRRYNKKRLLDTVSKHKVEIEEMFYFYSILFIARMLQILFYRLKIIKPNNKGVGAWQYSQTCVITKIIKIFLNIDFRINRWISHRGLWQTGLSLCLKLKKVNGNFHKQI